MKEDETSLQTITPPTSGQLWVPQFPPMHLFRGAVGEEWGINHAPSRFADARPLPPFLLVEGGAFVVVFVVFLA